MNRPLMNRAAILALIAAFALAACGGDKSDAAADGAATPAAAEAPAADDAATLAAAEAAAAASADPNAAAAPAADAASADPAAAPALPAAADGAIPGLTLGTDYEIIKGGQPFEPLNGKIEVVEVFNFVCPACAAFQPMISDWKKTLPPDVRFTYVPAAFGGNWDQYVRSFYTAQMMGIAEKAHDATYDAIHLENRLKGERGKDSDEELAAFYAQFGVDAKQFAANMKSFAVTGKFNKARQYIVQQQANSTPTLIVNGKYRVLGRSWEQRLMIANVLIAHERARAAAPAAA